MTRERELREAVTRLSEDAREAAPGEVQDEIDVVSTAEAQTALLDSGTRDFRALQDVRAALARLDDGTWGKCVICGRAIEAARLEAIPETPYCLEHAREADTEDKG